MAVTAFDQGRERIIDCNPAARAGGVRSGMPAPSALAILSGLHLAARDEAMEQQALERLASWCYQYSSQVCIPGDRSGLLLEARASRRLFGKPQALAARLERELGQLGYHAQCGSAPTPESAWLAAGEHLHVGSRAALRPQLGMLPLERLPLESSCIEAMTRMGFRRLRDILRLPQRTLTRRFGPGLPDYLARLLGIQPDPLTFYRPPKRFSTRLDLPAAIHSRQALLFPLKRLLGELCGVLRGADCAVQSITITLGHEDREDSVLQPGLQSPTQDPERLLAVVRERLERLRLPQAVREIRLQAPHFLKFRAGQDSLFGDALQDWQGAMEQLAERLQARLGRSAVSGLSGVEDHRPEYSWRRRAPGEAAACTPLAHRPAWLLPNPRRCEPRDYRILAGPERIESGWWDGRDYRRDYYIARDSHGSLSWIFHEYKPRNGWYLHGFFA